MDLYERLIQLNSLFQQKETNLFIVGGFVRDIFLNKKSSDVDLAGILKLNEIEQIINGTDFKLENKNELFGTAKILIDKYKFEYSTFRKEIYNVKGKHCPSQIEFVNDIRIDAQRRDFTCNSLYLNLSTNEIIDFYNGVNDIKHKRLVMINKNSFDEDGVRILRMFRFADKLDFKIDAETFKMAIKNIDNLKQVSIERKFKEIMPLFENITNSVDKENAINNFLFKLENMQ